MRIIALVVCLFSLQAHAQFKSESEASSVVVSGNTNSEAYSLRSKNSYTLESNVFGAFGRYLQSRANGVENARSCEAGATYERILSAHISGVIGHKAESDTYAGYIQRDSSDLGGKYYFIKEDANLWFAEAGYRYTKTLDNNNNTSHANFGRLYSEYSQNLSESLSYKVWAEYLPNFTENEAYLANAEPSLTVLLNSVFSLKLAYLVKYQNKPANSGKRVDTVSTTSIVAKF